MTIPLFIGALVSSLQLLMVGKAVRTPSHAPLLIALWAFCELSVAATGNVAVYAPCSPFPLQSVIMSFLSLSFGFGNAAGSPPGEVVGSWLGIDDRGCDAAMLIEPDGRIEYNYTSCPAEFGEDQASTTATIVSASCDDNKQGWYIEEEDDGQESCVYWDLTGAPKPCILFGLRLCNRLFLLVVLHRRSTPMAKFDRFV